MKILIRLLLLAPLCLTHAQVSDEVIQGLLEDCPESVAESYAKSVPRFARVLPEKKADPVQTLKAVLPRACFLELQDWQLQTALQLGHYGLNQGLRPSTISDLTEIQSWRTMAKEVYVKLGRVYEHMLKAGAANEEIAEVFFFSQNENLFPEQIEAISLVYAEQRAAGKKHADAFAQVKEECGKVKKLRGDKNISTYLGESPVAARGRSAEAPPTPDALWDQLENQIKAHDNHYVPIAAVNDKPVWNVGKLETFYREWKGTPYKWGGVTRKGVDCSGFVLKAIESQFPASKYPRSARDLAGQGKAVDRAKLATGDLIFFAASEVPGRITHVGIYVSGGEFAHASSKHGVTLAKLEDKYYTRRFVTARRLF